MEGIYQVLFGDKPVGKVQVTKEGLYYRFYCRCRMAGEVVSRLAVCWPDKQENLGILVPVDGGFGLNTRVAAKKCRQEKPEFRVLPHKSELQGKFIPLSPEEPFAYIQRLKDAFFERRYGQPGIVLRDTQMPKGTA